MLTNRETSFQFENYDGSFIRVLAWVLDHLEPENQMDFPSLTMLRDCYAPPQRGRGTIEVYESLPWMRQFFWMGRNQVRTLIGRILSRGTPLVPQGPAPVQSLRVLMYHRVAEDSGKDILSVTPALFSEQMKWLREEGYPIFPVEEGLEMLKRGILPDGALCLTFDDGYRDNYEHAFPVLSRYRLPAMIFPVTGFVLEEGEHPRYMGQNVKYLTVEQIREMRLAGIDFGCHTHTHALLPKINLNEGLQEIHQAKKLLEEWVGESVRVLAYPNGAYGRVHFGLLESLGFEAAFSTRAGTIAPNDSPWELRRTEISGRDSLRDFINKVRGGMDLMHRLYQGVKGFYR